MAYQAYLNGLDGHWLQQHNDNNDTWQTVLDFAQDNRGDWQ
jgi:hypothetical protein